MALNKIISDTIFESDTDTKVKQALFDFLEYVKENYDGSSGDYSQKITKLLEEFTK